MFIGHWAPALAAAAITPRAPKLGLLFVAAQLVDWAFFALVIVGVEKLRIEPGITVMRPLDMYHMPYTHSLLGSLVWAATFAVAVWLGRKDALAALLGAGVVVSHWFLDVLVHTADMSFAGEDAKFGLALWNYPVIAVALETAMVAGALVWYARRTSGPVLPLTVLAALFAILQIVDVFGPQPEAIDATFFATAFAAFGALTAAAWWVGTTRHHGAVRG